MERIELKLTKEISGGHVKIIYGYVKNHKIDKLSRKDITEIYLYQDDGTVKTILNEDLNNFDRVEIVLNIMGNKEDLAPLI